MSDDASEEASTETPQLVLSASLSPADASAARDVALEAVSSAVKTKAALKIELDGDGPSPCAMQLVVSAARTAGAQGVPLEPSEQVGEILTAANVTQ